MSIATEAKVAELEARVEKLLAGFIDLQMHVLQANDRADKLRSRIEALEGVKTAQGKRNDSPR
jgi:hypothetical protein